MQKQMNEWMNKHIHLFMCRTYLWHYCCYCLGNQRTNENPFLQNALAKIRLVTLNYAYRSAFVNKSKWKPFINRNFQSWKLQCFSQIGIRPLLLQLTFYKNTSDKWNQSQKWCLFLDYFNNSLLTTFVKGCPKCENDVQRRFYVATFDALVPLQAQSQNSEMMQHELSIFVSFQKFY